MKYICKECKTEETVNSIEEIVRYKKLCTDCISTKNKNTCRRVLPKETRKLQRQRNRK